MRENLRHIEAFEHFVALGAGADNATIDAVAEKAGVCRRTIKHWYKQFNWRARADQRNIENTKRLAKRTDDAIVNTKADHRAIIRKAVAQFKENLEEGKVSVHRVTDFDRLVKLDMLMMGEKTGDETTINIITAVPRPEEEEKGTEA